MPLEFYFQDPDRPGARIDYHLLEPTDRSGLYADYSTGEKQMVGLRCDEEDRGFIDIYPCDGELATNELKAVAVEDLPEPFATVEVTPEREYPMQIRNHRSAPELIARYKPLGEIGLGDSLIVIPTSLINPN